MSPVPWSYQPLTERIGRVGSVARAMRVASAAQNCPQLSLNSTHAAMQGWDERRSMTARAVSVHSVRYAPSAEASFSHASGVLSSSAVHDPGKSVGFCCVCQAESSPPPLIMSCQTSMPRRSQW